MRTITVLEWTFDLSVVITVVRAGTKRGKHFFLFPEVLKTEKIFSLGNRKSPLARRKHL